MTKEQFEFITQWQKETFGEATALSKINHLILEVDELKEELLNQQGREQLFKEAGVSLEREYADCFLLLFGSAAANGMSYEDICNCIDEKMEINKKRKWGKPQANGVVNHIKE